MSSCPLRQTLYKRGEDTEYAFTKTILHTDIALQFLVFKGMDLDVVLLEF